jgi:hypothetical protein
MIISSLLDRMAGLSSLPGAGRALRTLVLELAIDGAFAEDRKHPRVIDRRPLHEVCQILTGTSVNASEKAIRYAGLSGGLPYIATKDVELSDGAINYNNGVRIPVDEPGFKVAPPGTVFVCAEGGSAGKKIGLTDRPVCFGNKLFAVVPGAELLPAYLEKVVRTRAFFAQFTDQLSGIIGGVSLKKFREIEIPFPPVAEQEAAIRVLSIIEARLAEVEGCRSAEEDARKLVTESAAAKLLGAGTPKEAEAVWASISRDFNRWFVDARSFKLLRAAIVDMAVNGTLVAPDGGGVTETTLGALSAFGPKNGFSPKPVAGPTDTKTMSLAAVTRGIFDSSAFKYIQDRPAEGSDLWVRPGDILIQRANTIEYVGVSAVYTGEHGEFIYPDLIMRVSPKPGVDSRFLHLALSTSQARQHMRERASGTSGTMPKVNQATVRSVPIRLPSFEQQQRVVVAVDRIAALITNAENLGNERTKSGLALLSAWTEAIRGEGPGGGGSGALIQAHADVEAEVLAPAAVAAEAQNGVPAKPFDLSLQHDDDRTFEAVLVAAVVDAFFGRSGEPLGNFRLQKAVYFARRRLNDAQVNVDYLRKAAGPYNPKMRYSGGIAIAKSQGWIREARGRFGFGHIRGVRADHAQASTRLQATACWVRDTFLLRKNEEWERLATVDYASHALQQEGFDVTPQAVLGYIRDLDVWRHKVEKLALTEFSVQSAMIELNTLFPLAAKASLRADG